MKASSVDDKARSLADKWLAAIAERIGPKSMPGYRNGVKWRLRLGRLEREACERLLATGEAGARAAVTLLDSPDPRVVVHVARALLYRDLSVNAVVRAITPLAACGFDGAGAILRDYADPNRTLIAERALRAPSSTAEWTWEGQPKPNLARVCTRDTLRNKFMSVEWPADAIKLDRAVKPCLRITSARIPQDEIGLGASRLGGLPDLPPGVPWPEADAFPLAFVAQLNCGTFPQSLKDDGFPGTGTLLAFNEFGTEDWGDYTDSKGFRLMYFDAKADELERRRFPELLEPQGRYHCCSVQLWEDISLPRSDDARYPGSKIVSKWLPPGAGRAYGCDSIGGYAGKLQRQIVEHAAVPQINGKRTEAPRVLVLEFRANAAPGWAWADCGSLYYTMRAEDLLARRFERAHRVLQTS